MADGLEGLGESWGFYDTSGAYANLGLADILYGGWQMAPEDISFSPAEIAAFTATQYNFGADAFPAQWLDTKSGEILTADQARALSPSDWEMAVRAEMEPAAVGIDPATRAMLENPAFEGKAVRIDAAGNARIVNADGTPLDQNSARSIDRALGLDSALGRMLVSLGLGGVGMGLAAALAPGGSALRLPEATQNPVLAAGQRTTLDTIFGQADPVAGIRQAVLTGALAPEAAVTALRTLGVTDPEALVRSFQAGGGLTGEAALRATISSSLGGQAEVAEALRQAAERERVAAAGEAPIQALIRALSLAKVPEYLLTPEPADVVGAGIRDRVLKALVGQEVDPALERRIGEEREKLLLGLAKMYGRPGQETEGTVGGALVQGFDTRANELRYNVNRDILALLAPQEQARTAYRAGRRDTGLTQATALSTLGRTSPAQLAGSMATMVPIQPLLGINDAAERQFIDNLRAQAVIGAFNAENTAAQNQAAAINRLFGTAASALASTPSYNFTMANPAALAWAAY